MFAFRSSSAHLLCAQIAGAAICAVGLLSAHAQEPKKSETAAIPGGIEGHVKAVDHEKGRLSIVTAGGRERTFTVTDDTTMIGPRGGKVRRRLNDRRFHEGMELTVVASGEQAKEIHLGFSRRQPGKSATSKSAAATGKSRRIDSTEAGKVAKGRATKSLTQEEDDDEDNEIPGKVKSFDSTRRLLVVSLLNGKSRSFLLSSDVKVLVKGATSKLGLKDSALKEGASVTVVVDEGGRRVKELHVSPLPPARSRKAA
jgi:hypothetical protein